MAAKKKVQKPKVTKAQAHTVASSMVDLLKIIADAVLDVRDELRFIKNGLIEQHQVYNARLLELTKLLAEQPQGEKIVLLKQLVESQSKLAETIILLTAKGVQKAKAPKPDEHVVVRVTGDAVGERQAAAEKQVAAEVAERAARERDPVPKVVEEKKPDLKIVPDAPAAALTSEAVRTLFLDYHAKHDRKAAEALLAEFGAKKFSEVPTHQLAAFAEKCRAG